MSPGRFWRWMVAAACLFDECCGLDSALFDARFVKPGPKLRIGLARYRVAVLRGDFRQWFEDKGIAGDFLPGQAQVRFPGDEIAVENEVDVERARRELLAVAAAPMPLFDFAEEAGNFPGFLFRLKGHHQIVESRSSKPDGGGGIGARQLERSEQFPEIPDGCGDVDVGIDVAADAQENFRHGRPWTHARFECRHPSRC